MNELERKLDIIFEMLEVLLARNTGTSFVEIQEFKKRYYFE